MATGAYSFPVLKPAVIVQQLHDLFPELGAQESDFTKPTRDRWVQIFLYFLKHLLGVTPQQMSQPEQLEQSRFEYPELHDQSTFYYMLAIAMQRLMVMCGVDNFTFRNISRPTQKGCTYMMSALLNYTNFHDERMKVCEDIKHRNEEVIQQRRDKLENIEELRRKIDDVKAAMAKQQEESKQLHSHMENLASKITEKQQSANEKSKTYADLKQQAASTQVTNANLKESIAKKKASAEQLSKLIVQSPERKKMEMDHSAKQLGQMKAEQEMSQHRLVEVTNQAKAKENQVEKAEKRVKLLQAVQVEMEKDRDVNTLVRTIKEKENSIQEHYQETITREQQLKRQLAAKQEKLNKMTLQFETRIRSMREAKDQIYEEMKSLHASQSEQDDCISTLEQEMRSLQQENSLREDRHQRYMAECKDLHHTVMHALDEYHGSLAKTYEEVREEMKKNSW